MKKKTKRLYALIKAEIANLHTQVDYIHSKQILPISSVKKLCIEEYSKTHIKPLMLIYQASISKS